MPPTSYVDRDGANASSSAVYEMENAISRQGQIKGVIYTFSLAMRAPSLWRKMVLLSGLTFISQESMMSSVNGNAGTRNKRKVHTSRNNEICQNKWRLIGVERSINLIECFLDLFS